MFRTFLTKFAGEPKPQVEAQQAHLPLPPAPEPPPAPAEAAAGDEDHQPIFQTLAMTDELREALFPTTTQMVSAIFDRPAAAAAGPASPAPAYRMPEERSFPLL